MALRDQLRVMVVDDMSTSRGLITQGLETLGIRSIQTAADGQSALERLLRSPVHLVISDYRMPGLDGLGLLRALRSAPRTSGIGFLMITGVDGPGMVEAGQELGMNNLLRKPFGTADLKVAIEAIVGRL